MTMLSASLSMVVFLYFASYGLLARGAREREGEKKSLWMYGQARQIIPSASSKWSTRTVVEARCTIDNVSSLISMDSCPLRTIPS